jgi:cytochrome c-type biogenesis protein CcmH
VTAFLAIATVMVVIALAWLLWPLLRAGSRSSLQSHVANAAIYRDQFADLDADLARGTISEASHAEARAELERRLLDEGRMDAPASQKAPQRAGATAVVVALAVPVLAGLMYWQFGEPEAFSPLAKMNEASHQMSGAQVEEMVQQLADRLKKEPDNIEGWAILARTYYTMRRFPEAAAAYEKLNALVPNEPDLLADQADALAMSQGRNLSGRPMELVQQALKVDPNHWKALAMAGTDAFERKDFKAAVVYWERLRDTQPPDSPVAKSIANSIAEARQLGGMAPAAAGGVTAPAAAAKTPPAAAAPQAASKAPAASTASDAAIVGGVVTLSESMKAKVAPTDTVVIFARATEGSRMPLALTRMKASDLPARFALDDTMAMSPEMKLSSVPTVIVGARISKSGNPMPSSGDLEGLSKPAKLGTKDLAVTIDRVLP